MMLENFEEQKYMNDMSMHDARMMFQIRSSMANTRMNQRSDKNNTKISGNVENVQILILKVTFFGVHFSHN